MGLLNFLTNSFQKLKQSLNRVLKFAIVLIVTLMMVSNAFSATYYVDYRDGLDSNGGLTKDMPWKHSPGMVGFTGIYSHSVGDSIIFKGGITWPGSVFPFRILNDGTQVSVDDYTVDQAWFSGAAYYAPVFDGGSSIPIWRGILELDNRQWVRINGIKLINVGTSGKYSGARAIRGVTIGEGITISNCEIVANGNHGIVFSYKPLLAPIVSGVKINNCKISKATNNIEIGIASGDGVYDVIGVQLSNNEIFDPSTQLIGGDHGDGIHLFSVDKIKLFRQVKIFNNKFYGDWGGRDSITSSTANIFIENSTNELQIYNNHHTFSNSTSLRDSYMISPGFIVVIGNDNVEIYNNSISASKMATNPSGISSSFGVQTGIYVRNANNVAIKGNAILDTRIGISIDTVTGLISDFNIISPRKSDGVYASFTPTSSSIFKSLDVWRDELGQGVSSIESIPKFSNTITVPIDLSLRFDSPGIDFFPEAQAPTSIFGSDLVGQNRPEGLAWDAGAYEYNPPPAPPEDIRILD